jgi:hypothetical protein
LFLASPSEGTYLHICPCFPLLQSRKLFSPHENFIPRKNRWLNVKYHAAAAEEKDRFHSSPSAAAPLPWRSRGPGVGRCPSSRSSSSPRSSTPVGPRGAFLLSIPAHIVALLTIQSVSVLAVSRTRLSWAPEQLPHPAAPKRPDVLVLGPAAGQGRPDRLQCKGFPL